MTARSVSPTRAIVLTHRLLVTQLVSRGRLFALLTIGVAVGLVAWAVGASNSIDDPAEAGVRVIANLGFTTLVPIVALVFASASLGDAREDGTLVYLWLRPMDRWPVALGAWLAAITVSLPLTVIPLGISAALVDGGSDLVVATVVASVTGILAYSALFMLFGLLVKNSIVWGLAYILIWEGLVAAFGDFAAKLAIRGYTRSIITSITEVDLDLGDLSLGVAVAIPLITTVFALVLSSVRLRSLDVE